MKNAALPLLVIVLILGAVAWFLFGQQKNDDLTNPLDGGPVIESAERGDLTAKDAASTKSEGGTGSTVSPTRTTLEEPTDPDYDPVWANALAGFRGRVVSADGKPAADKLVRFFRIDPEVVQNPHVFAKDAVMKPQLEIYEARTGTEGAFEVTGVYPAVSYLMVADVQGENERVGLAERSPGPGEIVDLGDILLPDLGKISGRVVDANGEPAVGALVRAADVPGTALDFAPVERFSPEGGLIVDEGGTRVVLTMPPYVRHAFDLLPIATTKTDSEGNFVLQSVQPGANAVVVNYAEHVPLIVKGVRVKAGKEKKVGKLSLREGEIAEGRVLDSENNPIVGAEVLLASRTALPVHFAAFAKPTNEEGKFSMAGLAPGQVYTAVRRSPKEPWSVFGPTSVSADLELRIPAQHSLIIRVKSEAGPSPAEAEIKLAAFAGEGGPGLDLVTMGMVSWIDIGDRIERIGDGAYRIRGLIDGDYIVAVQAAGFAAAKLPVKLTADVEHTILIKPAVTQEVLVLDDEKKPVRNVRVYAQFRGTDRSRRMQDAPLMVGRTNREGCLVMENCDQGNARLSASHPAYGMYHVQAKLPVDGPIVFQVQKAGMIRGLLLEGGKPPVPGKWTVTIEKHWNDDRGAMPTMPRFAVANLEGNFRFHGLAPGRYRVTCIPSIAAIGSPGGIMKAAMSARFDNTQTEEAQVTSGNETEVTIDAAGRREVTGPSARISGTVMIDGKPGKGMVITGWSQSGRLFTEVDDAGRFDLGRVGVGWVNLQAKMTGDSQFDLTDGQQWEHHGEIKEGEDLQFDLTFNTSSLSGFVVDAQGQPAGSVEITASGATQPQVDKPKSTSHARVSTVTDKDGRFHFNKLVAGQYRITVQGSAGYAKVGPFDLQPGVPLSDVRLELQRVYKISGTLDMSVYPTKPEYVYVWFQSANGGNSRGAQVNTTTGQFTVSALPKGTYNANISCWGSSENSHRQAKGEQPVEVSADVEGVKIRPVFEEPAVRKK